MSYDTAKTKLTALGGDVDQLRACLTYQEKVELAFRGELPDLSHIPMDTAKLPNQLPK